MPMYIRRHVSPADIDSSFFHYCYICAINAALIYMFTFGAFPYFRGLVLNRGVERLFKSNESFQIRRISEKPHFRPVVSHPSHYNRQLSWQ